MSGSERGLKLYKIMADGDSVPNDEIAELIREVMFARIIGSKVLLHKEGGNYCKSYSHLNTSAPYV